MVDEKVGKIEHEWKPERHHIHLGSDLAVGSAGIQQGPDEMEDGADESAAM